MSTSTQTIDVKDYSIQFDYYQTISDKVQSHIFVECSDDPETKRIVTDIILAKKRAEDRIFAKMIAWRKYG